MTSLGRAILRFALAGLISVAATLVIAGVIVQRSGLSEARRDARERTALAAQGVVEPELEDALLDGNPAAVARLDSLINARILNDRVVRVKIWGADGRILYSDARDLIGERYPLGEDELSALDDGTLDAETSNVTRPENRFERDLGNLYSVYLRIRTPNGTPVLYEQYLRAKSLTADGSALRRTFIVPAIAALALLWLLQLPLAWRMARNVEHSRAAKEDALRQAINASDRERRRIAADLHDGVVQDLIGLSYRLAGAAQHRTDDRVLLSGALDAGAADARAAVKRLRTALVEINPQNLRALGLRGAIDDLTSPLVAEGIDVRCNVDAAVDDLADETQTALFGAMREALRNVVSHADASSAEIVVAGEGSIVRAVIRDDGKGFDAAQRRASEEAGHLGLVLHERLIAHLGGRVVVASSPGQGTTVTIEVPTRAMVTA